MSKSVISEAEVSVPRPAMGCPCLFLKVQRSLRSAEFAQRLSQAQSKRFPRRTQGQHNPVANVKQQACINKTTPANAMRAAEER